MCVSCHFLRKADKSLNKSDFKWRYNIAGRHPLTSAQALQVTEGGLEVVSRDNRKRLGTPVRADAGRLFREPLVFIPPNYW